MEVRQVQHALRLMHALDARDSPAGAQVDDLHRVSTQCRHEDASGAEIGAEVIEAP